MKRAESQVLIIFGASGDLTKRKLMPSLFELYVRDLLPAKFIIMGASRTPYTDEEYRAFQRKNLLEFRKEKESDATVLDRFLENIYYTTLNPEKETGYRELKTRVLELRKKTAVPDRIIFYLATPPAMYTVIPEHLRSSGLHVAEESGGWRRVIVEKPFGTNLRSAGELNRLLSTIFNEDEVYRIDHYLGKETVQNLLVLRFSNGIFEPLWNRNYIDYIEITATETLGVENRGNYFDTSGTLRDMVQNHLMQLMAFVAMEPPASFDSESIRDEKAKVLRSLKPLTPKDCLENVIRAQYSAGTVDGKNVPGYTEEANISPSSTTETYVSMRFFIDNWRWAGVPFFFYTGKRMAEKKSEIIIHFKSTPQQLFVGQCSGSSCNTLTIRIQPDEGIALKFGLKVPGAGFEVKQVSMDFKYSSLSGDNLPDAYERLLLDAMLGDATLYSRSDALDASWKFVDPILEKWKKEPTFDLYRYPAGTDGPEKNRSMHVEGTGEEKKSCPA